MVAKYHHVIVIRSHFTINNYFTHSDIISSINIWLKYQKHERHEINAGNVRFYHWGVCASHSAGLSQIRDIEISDLESITVNSMSHTFFIQTWLWIIGCETKITARKWWKNRACGEGKGLAQFSSWNKPQILDERTLVMVTENGEENEYKISQSVFLCLDTRSLFLNLV